MRPIQEKLLALDRIDIAGRVNEEMMVYVREAIILKTTEGSPPLRIFITSPGGSANFGITIYDTLRYYKGHKTAVVIGAAESAAATILQACEWRTITPNATVLIHNAKFSDIDFEDIHDDERNEAFRKQVRRSHFCKIEIYARRTGRTPEEIAAVCDRNKSMFAEEALAFGLVDQIIDTEADIKDNLE